MTAILVVVAALLVAYANGANDNFKGVATLFGSQTASYRTALAWATVTTFAGAVAAAFFANELIKRFSGKGLVPDILTQDPKFLASVGLAAAATVLLAALLGFPISTTHALMGALVGAGLVKSGGAVNLSALGSSFVLPLVVSPLLASLLAGLIYPVLRSNRLRLGINPQSCVCAAIESSPLLEPVGHAPAMFAPPQFSTSTGTINICDDRYSRGSSAFRGSTALGAQTVLDALHWLSAGTLSFARGLNDAPKIVALVVAFKILGVRSGLLLVGVAMAIGGLLSARKVAETMSKRITRMNSGQGFTANLVASALVLLASRYGLPVSTTHVSCGALFGIGAATGTARWGTIGQVVVAWVTTLPIAALLGATLAFALS